MNRFNTTRGRPVGRGRARLTLHALEDRTAPAIFTVTNTADAGAGSLRQAVLDANAAMGSDTIAFDATFSNPQTITLASELSVTGPVTITGPSAGLLTVSG